jgi:hypothetical protein
LRRLFTFGTAKKLKQTWVETAKIKSKWKAEKRREGLTGGPRSAGWSGDGAGRQNEERNTSSEFDGNKEEEKEKEEKETASPPLPQKSMIHPSRHPELESESKDRLRRKVDTTITNPTSTLHDLTREAYLRSSLHTYKSDPLNRRRGSGGVSGKGREREERGRGQPNMKLRMDAMLEKIKRDFT